jgi:hypothetical protein
MKMEAPKPYSNESLKSELDKEKQKIEDITNTASMSGHDRKLAIKAAQREVDGSRVAYLAKKKDISDAAKIDEIRQRLGVSPIETREQELLSAEEEADRRNYEKENGMQTGMLDTILGEKDVSIADVLHERALDKNKVFDAQKLKEKQVKEAQKAEINFRRWQRKQQEKEHRTRWEKKQGAKKNNIAPQENAS